MAISVVQTQSNSGVSVSTLAVTLTSTGSQNTIIVCVATNGTAFATGVQTSGGSHLVAAKQETDSAGSEAEIWYLDNVPAGQTSVTVTWASSPGDSNAVAYEVSGVYAAGGSLDKTAGSFADTASPTTWTSGNTATLSQAAEIAIGSSAQVGLITTITGPTSPWVNTIITSNGGICAGQKIVSATTALAYAGSTTHEGTMHSSTCVATFKAGTPPSLNVAPFSLPRKPAKGRGAQIQGSSNGMPGAAYVSFPSVFIVPRKPAKGAQGTRGSSRGSYGAPYVSLPSKFVLPGKPAKGRAAAVRGGSRSSPGALYIRIVPPGPSPFTPPVKPAKGRPASVRGSSGGSPGAPYFHISVFLPPAKPAKGRPSAVQGGSAGSPGAPYQSFPSPFVLPNKPARGRSSAIQGGSAGSPGARYVLIRISPFSPPKRPARGVPSLRKGSGRGGLSVNTGAPQVPRQLILSLASQAGTDDYGNEFPQGIYATAGVIEGPEIIASGSSGLYLGYSPSPGAGNLVFSTAVGFGADTYGNAYLPGTTSYFELTPGIWSAISQGSGVLAWYTATSEAGPWTIVNAIGFSTSGEMILGASTIQLGNLSVPIPVSGVSGGLPTDGNSGSNWAVGERDYINNCVNAINEIITALQEAGILD